MSICRRKLLGAVAAAATVMLPKAGRSDAVADFYRGKTLHLKVGAAAGGGYDLVGRIIAARIGAHIPGNPKVVVENIPGASGLALVNSLYNATPRDGTVIGLPPSAIPLEPRLKLLSRAGGSASFDVRRFGWIGSAAQQPQVLFFWHTAPIKEPEDLKTKRTVVGATAVGADSYFLPVILNSVMGAQIEVIPGYGGLGETLLAMERGEVQGHSAGLANLTGGKPEWLREGKVKIVMQFGRERVPELPDVPTAVELARTDLDREMLRFFSLKYDMAYVLIAPPDVPPERLQALRTAFDETMKDQDYIDAAKKIGLPLNPLTGDQVTMLIERIAAEPDEVVERIRTILDSSEKK